MIPHIVFFDVPGYFPDVTRWAVGTRYEGDAGLPATDVRLLARLAPGSCRASACDDLAALAVDLGRESDARDLRGWAAASSLAVDDTIDAGTGLARDFDVRSGEAIGVPCISGFAPAIAVTRRCGRARKCSSPARTGSVPQGWLSGYSAPLLRPRGVQGTAILAWAELARTHLLAGVPGPPEREPWPLREPRNRFPQPSWATFSSGGTTSPSPPNHSAPAISRGPLPWRWSGWRTSRRTSRSGHPGYHGVTPWTPPAGPERKAKTR